jgi:acyl-coenzyme A synthetase/AMP-(fatty) acid ligase
VEAAAVFYGLVHAGAVLVPIAHAAGSSDLTHALRTSQARAVIVESRRGDGAIVEEITSGRSRLEKLEHLIVVGDGAKPSAAIGFGTLTDAAAEHNHIRLDPAAPAVIGWTSGTTATPKGVLLSHRALCAEIRQHMAPLLTERTRGLLSTSPVSHVTGMLVSLLVPPLVGHDVHLMDYWDADPRPGRRQWGAIVSAEPDRRSAVHAGASSAHRRRRSGRSRRDPGIDRAG